MKDIVNYKHVNKVSTRRRKNILKIAEYFSNWMNDINLIFQEAQ